MLLPFHKEGDVITEQVERSSHVLYRGVGLLVATQVKVVSGCSPFKAQQSEPGWVVNTLLLTDTGCKTPK